MRPSLPVGKTFNTQHSTFNAQRDAARWGRHAAMLAARPVANRVESSVLNGECSMFRAQRGVALVITLIMISVITFMAVTFLVVSRRDQGQVSVQTDQLTAHEAAGAALSRGEAQIIATMLATTNLNLSDLRVSTNFINRNGFDPAAVDWRTNVNYDYTISGAPLSLNQALQNLANLHYDPRPPVVVSNRFYGSNEFRYYLDLDRNGVPTPNGWVVITNENGGFYDRNGAQIPFSMPPPPNALSNYVIGDPEYIGIKRRAELPYSADNEFVSRFLFAVIPAGRTLDVNYIHNYAKAYNNQLRVQGGVGDGFRRNQGVSSSENSLASFFVDLNTNAWPGPRQSATTLGSIYQYFPDAGNNSGSAFDDAVAFLRYRYATNYQNLRLPSF